MIENSTEAEGYDAMAYTAIDVRNRMTDWLPRHLSDPMTGITAGGHDCGVGVVGESPQKT